MEYFKIIVAVIIAVIGWIIAHNFTSARDVKNAQRATRVEAFTEAYKALARSGLDKELLPKDKDGKVINKAIPVENAIAIIHLYGTEKQSQMASKYALDFVNNRGADCTELVNSLRKTIREYLGGEDLKNMPIYLVVTPNKEKI